MKKCGGPFWYMATPCSSLAAHEEFVGFAGQHHNLLFRSMGTYCSLALVLHVSWSYATFLILK